MTTLVQLADRCQLALNDTAVGTWPQATIESWVLEAIRDYSQYFPRLRAISQLVTSNPGYEWGLQADFIDITEVEYPTGNEPPTFLNRLSYMHPDFFETDDYYDVQPENDGTGGILWLSAIPTAGEYIGVTYLAPHDASLASGDAITVREDHESILILFVIWQAIKERAATHLQDPDTTSDILQKMVNAEMQAEQEYLRAIRNASKRHATGAYTGPWRADVYDPIY